MPKRLKVEPHLSVEELYQRYRHARGTVEARHYLTDEAIANRSFESLDELEEVLFQRCRAFWAQPDFIRGLTLYHWWPRQADYTVAV